MEGKVGKFCVKCLKCGASYKHSCDILEWSCVESHEREMEEENHYEASWEDTCSKCSNFMKITFHCWEYPPGVINTTDIDLEGVELIDNECPRCPDITLK
jgi:hypothetical protein